MSEIKTRAFVKRKAKEAIQKLLNTIPNVQGRVSISRTIPTDAQNLPAILIYSIGETASIHNEAPRTYRRNLTVQIEVIAAGNDDDHLDFLLEDLGDKIENYMERDETLGDLVNRLELTGTSYQSEPDAQSPIGSLVFSYSVEIFTDAQHLDDSNLEEFQGTDNEWKVGHHDSPPDGVVDAVDEINVET
jgi:hypothetical protein